MSLLAKDSLLSLREIVQKKQDSSLMRFGEIAKQDKIDSLPTGKRLLPVQDLKELVSAKRSRPNSSVSPTSSSVTTNTPPKKTVKFVLAKNQTYHRHLTPQDLEQAWLSPTDFASIRDAVSTTITAFRSGYELPDTTMRGLEHRALLKVTHERLYKSARYRSLVLEHQRFFVALMGRVNPLLLSKFSQLLSADATQEAIELAELDAQQVLQQQDECNTNETCASE